MLDMLWYIGTDDEDLESSRDWVSPCICHCSSRWVHQDCVQRWVDVKSKQNVDNKVYCPQCITEYKIVCDEVNYFVQVLNKIEETANQLCPYLAGSIALSTVYWTAVSYGAFTVTQVMGEQEAIIMMEDTDSFILLLMLPAIPVGLILSESINWEKMLLLLLQRSTQLHLLRTIMPSFLYEPIHISTNVVQFNPAFSLITTLCSALLLPTSATIVGKLFFSNSYSNFQKTLLGGLVYIAVKGIFRIYQRP